MKRRRFMVIGLGEFGMSLAQELTTCGCEVLAVDIDAQKVVQVRDYVAVAAVADVRDRNVLAELVADSFDAAIVSIGGSLEAGILATLHLTELGVKQIWAEANSADRADVLRRIGATKIISPERDIGRRTAQSLANPNLIEYLPIAPGYGVVEAETPEWAQGKSLIELDLRRTMRLAIIAIRSPDGTTLVPGGDAVLGPEDTVTLVGKDSDVARFQRGP